MSEAEARVQGRREAAPAALIALLVLAVLAVVSWASGVTNGVTTPLGRPPCSRYISRSLR